MRKFFRRNGSLSQTLKPIIIERESYCIQFELGTETVKILKFNKISHASEQIIIDLSEWRELESKRFREFRKELAMSKSRSRKKYGFSYDSNEKNFDETVDLRYGNNFHLLTSSKQMLTSSRRCQNLLILTSSTEIRRSVSVP